MDHSVILLLLAGQFVLLYLSFGIIVCMGTYDKSVLRPPVHCLGIDIIVRPVILTQPAFLPPFLEILYSLVIGLLTMLINDRIEIYLRFCNVQEGFFTGLRPGFLGIEDIIGTCRHFFDKFLRRSDGCKRFDSYHNEFFYRFFASLRMTT